MRPLVKREKFMSANMLTETFGEVISPIAQIAAQSSSANLLSGAVDMKNIYRLVAILNIGVMTATATLDAKLTQAKTSGGTYKDITGKAIAQLTAAADSNPGKPLLIDLRADELDILNGYRFVKLSVTGATAATLYSATLLALTDYLPVDPTLWYQSIL